MLKAQEEQEAEEEEGELQATAEELEEERQDEAVRLLQGLYRARKARRTLREMVRANFVKEYNPETEYFQYRNKRTGEVTDHKPLALGDEDLPTPKIHLAPKEYSIRAPSIKQYALVVCNRTFDSKKIPDINEAVVHDYEALEDTLAHPYLCKFKSEDCLFMKDCSKSAFLANFEALVDRINKGPSEACFFVYICTQVTCVQGRSQGSARGDYLNFCDSNYGSTHLIQKTALALKTFAKMVKELNVREKCILLDIAHVERPKNTYFRTKLVYPSVAVYDNLAKMSGAVVIGSARSGISDVQKKKQRREIKAKIGAERASKKKNEKKGIASKDEERSEDEAKAKKGEKDGSGEKGTSEVGGDGGETSELLEAPANEVAAETEGIEDDENENGVDEAEAKEGSGGALAAKDKIEEGDADKIESNKKSKGKGKLGAKNAKIAPEGDETKEGQDSEDEEEQKRKKMEDKEEKKGFFSRVDVVRKPDGTFEVQDVWYRVDKLKKEIMSLKWMDNFSDNVYDHTIRSVIDWHKERKANAAKLKDMERSNYEYCSYHHERYGKGSIFGEWVVKALQGHACDEKKPRLSARQLFKFVHPKTQHEMKTRYRTKKLNQTVILATPPKLDDLDNKTTVGTIPSVPPKPDTPVLDGELINGRHTGIRLRSLKIIWKTPAFTGSTPIKYDLQMRGIAKYNKTWKTVASTWSNGTIRKNRFHVPHLTSGLEHQFRVRAWNWGGWGEFSEESDLFIPVAATTLSVQATIREAANEKLGGGTRTLLSMMRKYSTSVEAIQLGCWMLSTQATTRPLGFARASVGREICYVLLTALKLYPNNAKLQAHALLVLGWACYGHHSAGAYADELGAREIIETAKARFPEVQLLCCFPTSPSRLIILFVYLL